jgi:LPS O-antigen subunit length determinant protein (WzzB/FepE family)
MFDFDGDGEKELNNISLKQVITQFYQAKMCLLILVIVGAAFHLLPMPATAATAKRR